MVAIFSSALTVHAASFALDNASDPAYTAGESFSSLNGGEGLGEWQTTPSENSENAGFLTADSNGNGGGGGPGINSDGDVAFGFYAYSGEFAEAIRAFAGVLEDNQSFSIDFDNGLLDGEGAIQGFALQDNNGNNRFELFVGSGSSSYTINDSESDVATEVSVTDGGLRVVITVISEDSYDISLTDLASDSTTTFSGRSFGGDSGSRIDRVVVFNGGNSGSGSEYDLFVNNLLVECVSGLECSIIQAEGSNPACPGTQSIFSGPENASEFIWTLENNSSGASIIGLDNQQSVIVDNGSDVGTYDLILSSIAGDCASVCLIQVEVGSAPMPEAGNNSPICAGEDLILTATPIDDATYTWVGPDFFLSTEQNPIIVSAGLAADGEYSVSASLNGCASELSYTYVTILTPPECLIDGVDNVCPGVEQVVFYAPNDLVSYDWQLVGDATMENSPEGGVIRIIPAESGSFTLTLTVQDNSGCSVTCERTVTIGDDVGPELECPPEAFLSPGSDTSPEQLGFATASDNCDESPVVTFEDIVSPGECTGSEMITRIWTATDASGNISTCEQIIILQDSEPPQMEIPPDAVLAGCGADSSPEALGFATATDDIDPAPTVTYSDNTYKIDCDFYTIIERSWLAEDSCGNIAEFLQIITLEDAVGPEMEVPADVSVGSDADVSPEALGFATATDNCDSDPWIDYFDDVIEGDCPNQYVIQRFWTAGDACGNATEQIQTITVGGGQIDLTIPEDAVANCSDDTSPDSTGQASATDGLGGDVAVDYDDTIIPADCAGRYIIQRAWRAADACGFSEAVQTIVVDDLSAPELVVPADATIECGGDISTAELGEATAVDNCDAEPSVNYSDSIVAGECGSSYTIERLWSAVDQCGNIAEAVQTITVQDLTAPEMTIPSDALVGCGADVSPEALGVATASDNCEPEVEITFEDSMVPGNCEGRYTIERRWIAADGCGNQSEAVQVIVVDDTGAPALTIPADISVGCGESTDPDHTGTATATDDCSDVITVTYDDEVAGSTILRTWTATDACGNEASASQTISTSGGGSTPPVISSPGDQIVSVSCGQPVVFQEPTAASECDPNPSVVCVPPSGSVLGAGVHVITCTATDSAGNNSTTTFKVTVLSSLRVVFESPLADDNVANNIETDADVQYKFKSGATIPHKIKLFDCNNNDVTAAVADLVNVRLNVSLRYYASPGNSVQLLDMWELPSGLGGANGKMVLSGGKFQFNLKTTLYPPLTVYLPLFYRSHVTVAYKSAPHVIVGQEDALLESK